MTLCLPQTPPLPTHLPVFISCALALLCPQKSWSPTSTTKPVGLAVGLAENLSCRVHPVCTSAHNCIQSVPHDSELLHTPLYPWCRELNHPDTMLCHDSKAAQPSSTAYSHPFSPKSLHPHSYTRTTYSRCCLPTVYRPGHACFAP